MLFSPLFCLIVPLVLTVLAWREGLRILANATRDSTAHVRIRTWPAMIFLLGTVVMVAGLFIVRFRRPSLTPPSLTLGAWMFCVGALSSIAALVSSLWAMPRFRPLAFFAALGWTSCFGLVLMMLSALRGLR